MFYMAKVALQAVAVVAVGTAALVGYGMYKVVQEIINPTDAAG